MKSQSGSQQPLLQYSQGGILITFNSIQKTKIDPFKGEQKYWEADQIKVSDNPTRDEIIEAIIGTNFSIKNEIAFINNNNKGDKKSIDEYQGYQTCRDVAKGIADDVLTAIKK